MYDISPRSLTKKTTASVAVTQWSRVTDDTMPRNVVICSSLE